METRSNHRVRFKPFELDLTTRELRRNGVKLKVQGQPVEVLAMLLNRAGEVVTRDEMRRRLWPEDTFVDFEHSLNSTIRRLRETLGDCAENPRYIETLPRLGYRFIAPVDAADAFEPIRTTPNGKNGVATESVQAAESPAVQSAPLPQPAAVRQTGRLRRWRWVFGVAAMAAVAAAVIWVLNRPLPPPRITAYTQLTHEGLSKRFLKTVGNRVYFSFYDNTPDPIAQVSESGGEIEHVPIPLRSITFLLDVSADGSNFLIATNEDGVKTFRPLWNVRVPEGPQHRLPNTPSADFAPDGKTVAYATEQGEIWLIGSDGSGAHKLATVGGLPVRFAWSPDGGTVRFTNKGRLWEISANGSNLHELLPGWGTSSLQCCGRWTPDGELFVFQNTPKGFYTRGEIWAIDERHGLFGRFRKQPVQLASGPIDWKEPSPSKDGKGIFALGKIYRGELSRYDVKTQQFQPFLGGISAQGASFSRDGRYVAYVKYPEGTLWKADRDGSHSVQLTDRPIEVIGPRWSPDGRQILFNDLSSGAPDKAYVVSADGGSPRRVLSDAEAVGDPKWSPDGQEIVFSSAGPFNPEGFMRVLNLTSNQVRTVPGSIGMYSPRWSPDGRYIVAIVHDMTGLRLFDVGAQRWSSVINALYPGFPEWSKNSQWIYFSGELITRQTAVFRVARTGGTPELVVSFKDFNVTGWWNGWLGLDSTDAPLVLRDFGSDDVYALALERN